VAETQLVCGLVFRFLFWRRLRDLQLGDAYSSSLLDFKPFVLEVGSVYRTAVDLVGIN